MGPKKFDVSMLRLDTFYHKDGSWKNLAQDSQSSLAPEYIYVYIYIYLYGAPPTKPMFSTKTMVFTVFHAHAGL